MEWILIQYLGFELGCTTKAKTKGIWIWCRRHPTMENHCLVLVDTEGFGDVEKVVIFGYSY